MVFARTGEAGSGARGVSAFLIPLEAKGISRSAFDDMGTRSISRGSIFFDGVELPASHRLGEDGMGFVTVMQGFDFSRALIGIQCLGVARQSLAETWARL